MRLHKWFIWNFKATARLRAIDQRLDVLLLESVILPAGSKQRLSGLMVNMLPKLIKNYDFTRNFYAQFVKYSSKKDPLQMGELADDLSNLENSAVNAKDVESALMFKLLASFLMLEAVQTRSAYALRLRGRILAVRAKNMNDIVQYFLATKLDQLEPNWRGTEVLIGD